MKEEQFFYCGDCNSPNIINDDPLYCKDCNSCNIVETDFDYWLNNKSKSFFDLKNKKNKFNFTNFCKNCNSLNIKRDKSNVYYCGDCGSYNIDIMLK